MREEWIGQVGFMFFSFWGQLLGSLSLVIDFLGSILNDWTGFDMGFSYFCLSDMGTGFSKI